VRVAFPKTIHIFLLAFGVYFFSAAGYVDTVDALPSIDTAFALLRTGGLQVPRPEASLRKTHYCANETLVPGKTVYFTRMGLAVPALYLPAVGFELGVKKITGVTANLHLPLISLVNSFLSAILVALLFWFFLGRGFSHVDACLLSSIAAFATLIFPYAKTCHRESLEALCLTTTLVAVYRGQLSQSPAKLYLAASLAAGFGLLAKLAMAVSVLPMLGWGAVDAFRRRDKRSLAAILVPFTLITVAWLLFAGYAYGPDFPSGYSPTTHHYGGKNWSSPFFYGLYRHLLSAQEGLLFYEPVVLLALAAFFVRAYQRSLQIWEITAWVSIVLTVGLYARWAFWGEALGPRYFVIFSPLFVMLLSPIVSIVRTRYRYWSVAIAVVVWCFILQGVGTSVKMQQYWTMRSLSEASLTLPHWAANFKLAANKLRHREEIYPAASFGASTNAQIDLRNQRSLQGLNFWWLHLSKLGK